MRLYEYIQQGGPIMYILLALNVVGLAVMLAKFVVFTREGRRKGQVAEDLRDCVFSNPHARELDGRSLIEITRQELVRYIRKLELGLNTVKIIATVSPLLGLLGTVVGVLSAFRVISEMGLDNPGNFAGGISMALITTVGGLLVAIPNFVGHSYLLGMLDGIEADIEKELLSKVL